eukprot:scaffold41521_cov63-Phaeocystis_antarctica.AAC.4
MQAVRPAGDGPPKARAANTYIIYNVAVRGIVISEKSGSFLKSGLKRPPQSHTVTENTALYDRHPFDCPRSDARTTRGPSAKRAVHARTRTPVAASHSAATRAANASSSSPRSGRPSAKSVGPAPDSDTTPNPSCSLSRVATAASSGQLLRAAACRALSSDSGDAPSGAAAFGAAALGAAPSATPSASAAPDGPAARPRLPAARSRKRAGVESVTSGATTRSDPAAGCARGAGTDATAWGVERG